jgi:hypothetical protein
MPQKLSRQLFNWLFNSPYGLGFLMLLLALLMALAFLFSEAADSPVDSLVLFSVAEEDSCVA